MQTFYRMSQSDQQVIWKAAKCVQPERERRRIKIVKRRTYHQPISQIKWSK